MIELYSEKNSEETLAQLKRQNRSLRKARKALRSMERSLLESHVSHIHDFRLFNVVSEKGDHFEELEFIVSSRFTRNGDTYLAGDGFCVNISRLMREAREALRGW